VRARRSRRSRSSGRVRKRQVPPFACCTAAGAWSARPKNRSRSMGPVRSAGS